VLASLLQVLLLLLLLLRTVEQIKKSGPETSRPFNKFFGFNP
jgi:hypothetical protein